MKIDEPFNSEIKSDSLPESIKFVLATSEHVDAVSVLMHKSNSNDQI